MFMREKKRIEFFNGYNAGGKHVERICVMSGWFCLGTKENPLCGAFDGDGHRIQGRFPLMDSVTPRAMFHMEESAVIENMELCNDLSPGEIRIAVKGGLMSA